MVTITESKTKIGKEDEGYFNINPTLLTRKEAEDLTAFNFGESNLPQFKKYLDSTYSRAKRNPKKLSPSVTIK